MIGGNFDAVRISMSILMSQSQQSCLSQVIERYKHSELEQDQEIKISSDSCRKPDRGVFLLAKKELISVETPYL